MPRRCLIVDDSAHFLEASQNALTRQGVAVVGLASTIAEGLEQARQLDPDVILVDIDLGGESGFDLVRRLAAEDRDRSRKVILISAHREDDFEDLIADSPVDGFLSKSDISAAAIEKLTS